MNISQYNRNLFSYLRSSPTPFHAVETLEQLLLQQGFERLHEHEFWHLEQGHSYFLIRENSAAIAFTLGQEEEPELGFRILAAHTDSPCLQIKPRADIKNGTFHQLGVEVYGGSLLSPWFDRDLSLAGRVCCEMSDGSLEILLIDFHRPLLTIPSIAIHLNREANTDNSINKQKHLPPIIAQSINGQLPDFSSLLLAQTKNEHPDTSIEEILAFDIFCYDFQEPSYLGINNELISSARLDNLLSCHAGITAITNADRKRNSLLFCANHEENGSTSTTGAHGSFIDSVIDRILPDPERKRIALSNSFLISTDNAHASHPNFSDKMDSAHEIQLNMGPVIKLNANQRYATNSSSASVYKCICKQAEITPQEFVMRSDLPCGSTIGPITAARLGVRTLDVGAPSLGMHSIRELTGSSDPFLLYQSIVKFLSSDIHKQFN